MLSAKIGVESSETTCYQLLPAKLDVRLLMLLRAGVKVEHRAAGRQHRMLWHCGDEGASRAEGVINAERVSNIANRCLTGPVYRDKL